MDALFFLAPLLGLIVFDLLAIRFGADSRDLVNTRVAGGVSSPPC
jgi:hypothetical protein